MKNFDKNFDEIEDAKIDTERDFETVINDTEKAMLKILILAFKVFMIIATILVLLGAIVAVFIKLSAPLADELDTLSTLFVAMTKSILMIALCCIILFLTTKFITKQ